MLGDKTVKPPPYTTEYRLFKYKPDCSRLKAKKPDLLIAQGGKNKAEAVPDSDGNDACKNDDLVINAEIVCHGNCKCHPNE